MWKHPLLPDTITLSGNDGDDAKRYQERLVADAIRDAADAREEPRP